MFLVISNNTTCDDGTLRPSSDTVDDFVKAYYRNEQELESWLETNHKVTLSLCLMHTCQLTLSSFIRIFNSRDLSLRSQTSTKRQKQDSIKRLVNLRGLNMCVCVREPLLILLARLVPGSSQA